VIYLKNGSIYRGHIVEQVRDSLYKIEIYGGSTIVLSGNEILKITQEQKVIVLDRAAMDSMKNAKRINKQKNLSFGLELALSYILYHTDASSNYGVVQSTTSGGGLSILPEIRKGKHFSILIGASVNYILAKNYLTITDDPDYISIEKGYQIRFELPLWFRWTYGNKVQYFFQFGWGIGVDIYRGWGSDGQNGGAYQFYVTNGWQILNRGFMDVITLGVGIRKHITPQTEIISYIDLSPADLQFATPSYNPCAQFHLGFNFNTKARK